VNRISSLLTRIFYLLTQRKPLLAIDLLQDTKRSESLESKIFWLTLFRGGIAIVWLGQKNGENVAMK
jgi:hypothetical protein